MTTTRFVAVLAFVALAVMLAAGMAQQEAEPAEAAGLRTASYSLHAVEGSGVSGQLQVVEQLTGGILLILTLVGAEEDRTYPAALYEGDCGPDRPVYLELEPVGRENDPNVGITESELSFTDVTERDLFVFVFDGDTIDRPETEGLDVPALACGEVGLTAVNERP